MRRAAELFHERQEELARLATLEMGMAWNFSYAMAGSPTTDMLEYYAEHAERFLAPQPLDVAAHEGTAYVVHQPLGIIYAIEPWNVPYNQAIRPTSTNLMAGNVVILKHASIVPQCAEAVAQIMKDAGVPEGVFTNLRATHEQSERIIADWRVRGITLTGSDAAGAHIAALAGKAVKKTVMELGGSDAMIVLDDADLENATSCATFRFVLAGQGCALTKRIIVDESVYDEFLEKFTEKAGNQTIGDPMDPNVSLGPLSSQGAADEVKDQIRRAVEGGATAIEVGPPVPETGAFVQPTILTGVTRDNPIFHEEIFGPVPVIFKVANEAEAIELANDSIYGLGGSVYSADLERAQEVALQIDTGMVAINQPIVANADMPFGGTKRSGYGLEMGPQGILEFVNTKLINLAPTA